MPYGKFDADTQTHKITPVVKPRTCVPRVKDVYDDDKDYDKDYDKDSC